MDRRAFLACATVVPYVFTHFSEQSAVAQSVTLPGAAPAGGTLQNPVFTKGMKRVLSWDTAGNWQMDNTEFQFFGGEIHPSRIPEQYWEHRIQMVKALGCNTISLYIMWNFHERPDGSFDFCSRGKDIGKFIDLCARNGMWVLMRPGPYICGEWDFGGLPPRMLADPLFRDAFGNLQIRQNAPSYMAAAEMFNRALYENVVKGRTLSAGGPIMLVGLENEYTNWPGYKDPAHIFELAKQWIKLGYSEKFCICDGSANGFNSNHLTLPPNTAYGMTADGNNPANYDSAIQINKTATFGAECYPGWINHWGDQHQTIKIDSLAGTVAALAKAKRSFVFYVAHGGTNFGFTAGSNGYLADTQPDVTSYDYGAPISEAGTENDNFYLVQAAYVSNASYQVPFAGKPSLQPAIADNEVAAISKGKFSFRNFLKHADLPIKMDMPQTVETLALHMNANKFTTYGIYPSGIAIYQVLLPAAGGDLTITFERSPDYAIAYVNDVLVAGGPLTTVAGLPKKTTLTITGAPANSILKIVSMPFGRTNSDAGMLTDGRGLSGEVFANGVVLSGWSMSLSPMTAKDITNLSFDSAEAVAGSPFHAKATFNIDAPKDMYIDMTDWETGYVFVNGHNLGRYWTAAGPQKRLYCPGVWLVKGQNDVVIFEFTKGSAGDLSFYGKSGMKYSDKAPASGPAVFACPDGYHIQNVRSNLLLQSNNGTPVLAAADAAAQTQTWNIIVDAGNVKIINRADQSILALDGSAAKKWQATWLMSNCYTLTSIPENLLLEAAPAAPAGAGGFVLALKPKVNAEAQWPFGQYWRFLPAIGGTYYIVSKATGQRLAASDSNIVQLAAADVDAQKWQVSVNESNGSCSIVSINTQKSLDVIHRGMVDDSPVVLWEVTGGSNQQFNFILRPDGKSYAIIGVESGLALTMKNGAAHPTIWKDAATDDQSWILKKV
ncbi:hypothetical protein HB779_06790 [Phyllobacterium sp. 628]|uniref:beta-galactosidase n=1 Tax=Phyllobacterium sp. 628 TaxID=2718938 RepID=UPI00166247FB|nr:beta-galactosidase [Phyllobacterium sp. 628]QND51636.1 hypothetical protein HB779_06790 [Phyllobacterium sp. 628]